MSLWLFDFDNLAVADRCFVLVYADAILAWISPLASVRVVNLKVRKDCRHCIIIGRASVLHRYGECLFGRVTLLTVTIMAKYGLP